MNVQRRRTDRSPCKATYQDVPDSPPLDTIIFALDALRPPGATADDDAAG